MRRLVIMVGVLACCYGCAPQLAQKPIGAEEQEWQKYIKKNYRSWSEPQAIPPDKILNPTPYDKGEVTPGTETDASVATPDKAITTTEPAAVTDTGATAPAATPVSPEPALDAAAPVKDAGLANAQSYTVAKNDSLWKIAKKFYNSGNGVQKIKDANQGVLKGSDKVVPGMKLQIPLP
jgi:nucleoid-associated protein YgaU